MKHYHKCREMKVSHGLHHPLNNKKPFELGHGSTIRKIEFDEEYDVWVAHCDEYGDVIKYCPFCGRKL
jgi:hypothetical protein